MGKKNYDFLLHNNDHALIISSTPIAFVLV